MDAAEDAPDGASDADAELGEGGPPDATTAAAADAASARPDAAPARPARPARPTPRRVPRTEPPRSVARDAAVAPPRDLAPPSAPATAAAPPSAPPTQAASPPAGPRLRLGPGITAQGAPADGQGWAAVPEAGLMLTAEAPGGPAVRVRLIARGGRFVATVASNPFGHLRVDGRDLGPTPVAGVPLHAGTRRLVVTTPGGQTPLTLECAP
ncbi:MAG: hypothetical protein H6702_18595 [Myxococcales bacterium]|nr:hypothetical protein [Myxococcales bacterium]